MHGESVSRLFRLAVQADPEITFSLHLPPLNDVFDETKEYSHLALWQTSDLLYKRITAASQVMQHAARALSHRHVEVRTRLATQEKRLYKEESRLRAARQTLQTTRRTIFVDTLRSRGMLEATEISDIPYRLPAPITPVIELDEGYFSATPPLGGEWSYSASEAGILQSGERLHLSFAHTWLTRRHWADHPPAYSPVTA